MKHRKQEATVAARKALAFLEETVSSYHGCVRVLSTKNEAEDDTPAFVDAQSLRSLAAGEVGWAGLKAVCLEPKLCSLSAPLQRMHPYFNHSCV